MRKILQLYCIVFFSLIAASCEKESLLLHQEVMVSKSLAPSFAFIEYQTFINEVTELKLESTLKIKSYSANSNELITVRNAKNDERIVLHTSNIERVLSKGHKTYTLTVEPKS